MTALPIESALPDLLAALESHGRAVLQAPPGAGKTTRAPLFLLENGRDLGRIVMLEPRRLAARAAAERMAETLGEQVGRTVGYRMRGATKVSAATRIEVVTEGVLTRMLLDDPSLPGVGTVIFDEFHERSLNADLGLALAWEVRTALRPQLRLLVMSATLDAQPVADLLDGAPIVTAEGRSDPVETIWLNRPTPRERRFEDAFADLIAQAARETSGGILGFLPGAAEIRRVSARLEGLSDCTILPLYGALPAAAQRAAIAPLKARKVVLSTSIAETSLTIEGIRVVADGGLARRQRHDPGSGMSRLVTEKVSRAEADQRRGRAGRVAPGRCYRLWTRGEEGGLSPFAPPEIEIADLAGLTLDLAVWGDRDGSGLAFLTRPPEGALTEAQALLQDLGMLDGEGAPTEHGRRAARLPTHPRIAHMLLIAGRDAATLAAALTARPTPGAPTDLAVRLSEKRDAAERAEANRLSRLVGESGERLSIGAMTALAFPDRIALRRPGADPRWLTSGGKGVAMPSDDPLAGERLVAVAETDGHPREARIRSAARLTDGELREIFGDRIERRDVCVWWRREGRVITARQERLGALILSEAPWPDAPEGDAASAMLEGVRELGLPWTDPARRFAARVERARAAGASAPAMDEPTLMESLEDWLAPHLADIRRAEAWRAFDLLPALEARLSWAERSEVDAMAPATFETPRGRRVPIDYDGDEPAIAVRLQELFGVTRHPTAAGAPIQVTLLSPAGRPIQVTKNLPGFWKSSYADVRRDMRGRYPKHAWPEDPSVAEPPGRRRG